MRAKPRTVQCRLDSGSERSSQRGEDQGRSSSKPRSRHGFLERLGIARSESPSEDEIREAVDDAAELTEAEKRMINDIIDLGDTTASEICTPRVDVMVVQDDESIRAALERMRGTGYTRLPVCHGDIDDILGLVNYKDLIGPLMDGSIDEPVVRFMYDAMFVPETKDVIALLGDMQAHQTQMAIVIDEYGGTKGIVTVEDILEEIVGDIADESDMDEDMVKQVSEGVWRVEGRLPIEDAEELGWPVKPSDDYETIAGWLLDELDSVPASGDSVEVDGYVFTIVRMRRSRISVIKVERLDGPAPSDRGSAEMIG